jgi:hypothetical protein
VRVAWLRVNRIGVRRVGVMWRRWQRPLIVVVRDLLVVWHTANRVGMVARRGHVGPACTIVGRPTVDPKVIRGSTRSSRVVAAKRVCQVAGRVE